MMLASNTPPHLTSAKLAGVRHGKTMGGPVGMRIENRDWQNANWQKRMAVDPVEDEIERVTQMRPGHADLAGAMKYGLDDIRPVLERASARETTARVAVSAVARKLLEELGIQIHSHVVAVYDQGESDGLVYLAMEYVPGRTLRDVLARVAQ